MNRKANCRAIRGVFEIRPTRIVTALGLCSIMAAGCAASPVVANNAVGIPTQRPAQSATPPHTVLLDPTALLTLKQRAGQNEFVLDRPLRALKNTADKALKASLESVTDKTQTPPSGDKHDFLSQAPYYWPDPAKADGKPYVRKDGLVNPEALLIPDSDRLTRMENNVGVLALEYYVTGKDLYAAGAARQLRVWFIEPKTRMNPNMNHAQFVPGEGNGRDKGRGAGIIDSHALANIPDWAALLDGSPAWTAQDMNALKTWYRAYLDWLTNSANGIDESDAPNNHGTWYAVQVGAAALFVGDARQAKSVVEAARERIAAQISPDGAQPFEEQRTRALTYGTFNLQGLFALGHVGERVAVDLWCYATPDGRSLRGALDYMLKATSLSIVADPKRKQITTFRARELAELALEASAIYGNQVYMINSLVLDPGQGPSRYTLLYFRDAPVCR